jgi:cytochrome c553
VQAEGTGKTPRLAGQNGRYSEELGKFNVGDRQHAPEMTAVAHNLDGAQIRALAAYLQPR